MKAFLGRLPFPISGLMLALAAMGNLVAPWGLACKYVCGALAAVIFLLLLAKAAVDSKTLREGLRNPVISSVLPTFGMGTMILATYIESFGGIAGYAGHALWFAGLTIHAALMVSFIVAFAAKPSILNVYPSAFIPFVGLAVASTTAPAFDMLGAGLAIFWFAIVTYAVALPVVLVRVLKYRGLSPATRPLLGVFAAPASLCLLAYLTLYRSVNATFALALAAVALASTVIVLAFLPVIVKRDFYPSYAALGFPFVVSALAMTKLAAVTYALGMPVSGPLATIARLERLAAIAILALVLARYCAYLAAPGAAAARKRA